MWPTLTPRPIDRSGQPPRADWDVQFQAMAPAGHDRLLDSDELVATEWDETEWEWTSSDSDAT